MKEISIGEFARRSRLSLKALRLYDKRGVLVPSRVDRASGYRYYDTAQLDQARLVVMMRELQLPLKAVRELLACDPADAAKRIAEHWRDAEAAHDARRERQGAAGRAAKSLVFAVVTFVVGEFTTFVAFFVGQALISGHAPHAALGDPGVTRALVGAGLYLSALAVLSVAAGTLLRHPAAAIAAMVGVLFVLPGIAQALPDSWRNPVTEFWPTQAGSQLTSVYHSAHSLQPWPGFGVMCLFVAIVYAIAWTLLDRRDA